MGWVVHFHQGRQHEAHVARRRDPVCVPPPRGAGQAVCGRPGRVPRASGVGAHVRAEARHGPRRGRGLREGSFEARGGPLGDRAPGAGVAARRQRGRVEGLAGVRGGAHPAGGEQGRVPGGALRWGGADTSRHSGQPGARAPGPRAAPARGRLVTRRARPAHHVYFSFGANMAPAVLRRRGITPVEGPVPAVLVPEDGWQLEFRHRAGYATVVRTAQGRATADEVCLRPVRGAAYVLTVDDFDALARAERGYEVREAEVRLSDAHDYVKSGGSELAPGAAVSARIFVSQPDNMLPRGLPPPSRYKRVLVEGARSCKLEAGYVAALEALPETSPQGYGLPDEYYDTPALRRSKAVAVAALLTAVAAFVLTRA
ncbi:unnamed protein product [Pedinophyceae sp. YPF-701]|nr:unnamed protein product [Pedinophyceae sp. YPF-701]